MSVSQNTSIKGLLLLRENNFSWLVTQVERDRWIDALAAIANVFCGDETTMVAIGNVCTHRQGNNIKRIKF